MIAEREHQQPLRSRRLVPDACEVVVLGPQHLLERNGWRVRATFGLGSARSELLFRAFLPPSFLEFVVKQVTGKYPSRLARYLPDAVLAPVAKLVRTIRRE